VVGECARDCTQLALTLAAAAYVAAAAATFPSTPPYEHCRAALHRYGVRLTNVEELNCDFGLIIPYPRVLKGRRSEIEDVARAFFMRHRPRNDDGNDAGFAAADIILALVPSTFTTTVLCTARSFQKKFGMEPEVALELHEQATVGAVKRSYAERVQWAADAIARQLRAQLDDVEALDDVAVRGVDESLIRDMGGSSAAAAASGGGAAAAADAANRGGGAAAARSGGGGRVSGRRRRREYDDDEEDDDEESTFSGKVSFENNRFVFGSWRFPVSHCLPNEIAQCAVTDAEALVQPLRQVAVRTLCFLLWPSRLDFRRSLRELLRSDTEALSQTQRENAHLWLVATQKNSPLESAFDWNLGVRAPGNYGSRAMMGIQGFIVATLLENDDFPPLSDEFKRSVPETKRFNVFLANARRSPADVLMAVHAHVPKLTLEAKSAVATIAKRRGNASSAHATPHSAPPRAPLRTKRPCFEFRDKGTCSKGARCTFAHTDDSSKATSKYVVCVAPPSAVSSLCPPSAALIEVPPSESTLSALAPPVTASSLCPPSAALIAVPPSKSTLSALAPPVTASSSCPPSAALSAQAVLAAPSSAPSFHSSVLQRVFAYSGDVELIRQGRCGVELVPHTADERAVWRAAREQWVPSGNYFPNWAINVVRDKINEGIRKGWFRKVPRALIEQREVLSNALGLVWRRRSLFERRDAHGKARLTHDYSRPHDVGVNATFTELGGETRVQYEDWRDVLRRWREMRQHSTAPWRFAAKIDQSAAYHYYGIHPKHRKYTAFQVDENVYVADRMLFGFNGAPRFFQRAQMAIVHYWRRVYAPRIAKRVEVFIYLDDILIVGANAKDVRAAFRTLCSFYEQLGVTVAVDKCVECTTCVDWLGALLDLRSSSIRLPESKASVWVADIDILLKTESRRRFMGDISSVVSSVVGRLAFAANFDRAARLYLPRLYAAIDFRQPAAAPGFDDDLKFWRAKLSTFATSIDKAADVNRVGWLQVATDATLEYWAAAIETSSNKLVCIGKASVDDKHIGHVEMRALLEAARAYHSSWQAANVGVHFLCDNTQCVYALERFWSRDWRLLQMAREFVSKMEGIPWRCTYIASADNVLADALSRGDGHRTVLAETAWRQGIPLIDLAAHLRANGVRWEPAPEAREWPEEAPPCASRVEEFA